jgi:FAD/FMN-containing dehydrogenase
MKSKIESLALELEGECYTDQMMRVLYSTDASAYSEMPVAVVIPRSVIDLKKLIAFASAEKISLIPRTAGTSLAGQVVGNGIIVDVSKYFNKFLS